MQTLFSGKFLTRPFTTGHSQLTTRNFIRMYSKEQTQQLQATTKKLLKNPGDVEDLRNVLRFHEHRYYVLNDPLISDFEYDQLYKSLEKTEAENPKLITPDSP